MLSLLVVLQYIPDDYPLDSRWFQGTFIEQVLFIEEFKMFIVVESLGTSLKFFNTRFRPTHSFQPPAALRSIKGRTGDKISMHIGAPTITCICYAPALEAICISTSDNWLGLYHITELNLIVKVQSPLPVSFCCWCNAEEMLLTVAGDDKHLECWDIKSEKQVPVEKFSHKTEVLYALTRSCTSSTYSIQR